MVTIGGTAAHGWPPVALTANDPSMDVPKGWLHQKLTVAEAEAMHSDPAIRAGRPFGAANHAWMALRAQVRPGDELWLFDSSRSAGPGACGNHGVCIYRHGKCAAGLLLRVT